MKLGRLKAGQRKTPSWVAERMAERPAWRCRNAEEEAMFMDFMLQELSLRVMMDGALKGSVLTRHLNDPPPSDGRKKPWTVKAFADAENGARAVVMIREIFEDYWVEGREAGRQYRGHDPSAEQIAAAYVGCSVEDVQRVLKRSKAKRPSWK